MKPIYLFLILLLPSYCHGQIITTIAGTGTAGYSGDGGPATSAEISTPFYIAADNAGNIYFSDEVNNAVRKISPSGIITTIGGNGTAGYNGDGGPATAAGLGFPTGIAMDHSGNIYVAQWDDYGVIRKIDTSGIISTIAGTGTSGYSGDGGPATSAQLNQPSGMAFDDTGNLYIVDPASHVIRKVSTSGIISTIAGNGTYGISGDGGPATAAKFEDPFGIVIDHLNNIYISDRSDSGGIRKIKLMEL